MQCPDRSFLTLFARDPDAALDDLPAFEEHLSDCETCRQAIDAIADDLHGEKPLEMVLGSDESDSNNETPSIPGYRLLEAIRSGGSGTVYRGVHLASGRIVAVKVIQSVLPSHWKRIVLERESLVQCDHPNIVTLLDYGQIPGGCYFVTRWMEQSLSEYIAQNPVVDLRQAVEWMKQIAEAVQYVHKLGIVHRDLKPSNVLLNATGRPKLTDFGIAKQVLLDEGLTTTAAPIGTPGYMAPEQTGRLETPVSFATDVYGLGAVLYSILTGRPPFLGGNPIQVLDQVVDASPISPRKLRADIPVDLERICLKCLEKLPADRYESTADLIDDLNRFVDGVPVKARPIWRVVQWTRIARRQPVISSLIGLVGIVLLLAAIGATNFRLHALQQQRESEVRSVLQAIATSSPDQIDSLLGRLSEMDHQTVNEQITLLTANDSGDVLTRLRWSCASTSAKLALSSDELQRAVVLANVQELPVLLNQLSTHPVYFSVVFQNALRLWFESEEVNENVLRMASLRATIEKGWEPESTIVRRILSNLSLTPIGEAAYWSRALEPISSQILDSLVNEEAPKDRNFYWESASVQSIAWHWSRNDATKTVQFVKNAPHVALKSLVEMSEETQDQTLPLLNREFRALRNHGKREPATGDSDSTIASLTTKFDGLVTEHGGFFKRVPKDQLMDMANVLASLGWCPCQLHPFDQDGEIMYSVTFERSSDQCEIEFAVTVGEFQSRMEIRRREGFEATYICALPADLAHLTVLWRKGPWRQSQFMTSEHEAREISASLSSVDDSKHETQLLIHFYDTDLDDNTNVCLSLLSSRPTTPLESDRGRHFDQRVSRLQQGVGFLTQRFLESTIDGHRFVSVSIGESQHDELAAAFASNGATPVYIEIESESGLCHSKWRLVDTELDVSNIRRLASLAIGSWILGDPSTALESMNETVFPNLRTHILEWLGRLDTNASHFLNAFERSSTSHQHYGLLVALANWRKEQFESHRNEFLTLFRKCWNDNDPGVHFAADHLLRIAFPKDANTLVDVKLSLTHGLLEQNQERRWFYGPFGLPFVIIDPTGFEMNGKDDRVPWIGTSEIKMIEMDYRIAVCAIETPEWLMRMHLSEMLQLGSIPTVRSTSNIQGPAQGHRIDSMLRFCRWLNEREGLDLSLAHFPNYPHLEPGPDLPADYLTRDGYRLPRHDEWEIVCRAGSWSRHFLGDSLDFINEFAWTSENTLALTGDGGAKKPSPNGMFDILGNVYETVLGNPKEKKYGHLDGTGVWRFEDTEVVLLRGGSFLSHRIYCSSGAENGITPVADINAGFRIVRTLSSKTIGEE